MRLLRWLGADCPPLVSVILGLASLVPLAWQALVWEGFWCTFRELRSTPELIARDHVGTYALLPVAMILVPALLAGFILFAVLRLLRGRGVPFWAVVAWPALVLAFALVHVIALAVGVGIGLGGGGHC
jgi:hypothetical protein